MRNSFKEFEFIGVLRHMQQYVNYFFFSPPAHPCAVTYMTEISLIVTLNNQFNSTQFSHICDDTDVQADWRRSCTYGRAPNAIDISQGSLTCPSYTDTGGVFIRWFRHTAPFSCLLRYAGYTEDVLSTLTPVVLTGELLRTLEQMQVPNGTGPGVRRS